VKIEKINDNKIRCTLTREDLDSRHIKLSELAYGSEKAKMLFRDMMQQANSEFGFEAEDIPLMIEAVPLSADTITIIISKVEYPDEMDTRFSRFTEGGEGYDYLSASDSSPAQTANDILNLFRESDEKPAENKTEEKEAVTPPKDITKLFCFEKLDTIIRTAKVLKAFELGYNSLYTDPEHEAYYLVIKKSSMTPEAYNKVCNILCEYSNQYNIPKASVAYFNEHFKTIALENALQKLAAI